MEYKATIGLEVHAELRTKTKMFCACKNDTDEKRPNINICPICMGHPGTLPVINKEAVQSLLKIGIAVGGKLADKSEFDRKNYFYPDIPKGYQISQYKYPLVSGGELSGVKLTRIHLEEDTAKSTHGHEGGYSLVDFNRAGVPLMELVTEPVIHSAKQVSKFGQELQLLLQYLGIAEANMEKGEMRLEANISVSNNEKLGTKVEVKNLNSFRSAERAVEYEIERQTDLLDNGAQVKQETRGWDEKTQTTFAQRSKEDSHDYRYFPDPDLPKLDLGQISEFNHEKLEAKLSETPMQKRQRMQTVYSIKEADIDFYIANTKLASLFENAAKSLNDKKHTQLLSNYVISDIASIGEKGFAINSKHLSELISMLGGGEISSRGAKDILVQMVETQKDPRSIATDNHLFQQSDYGELENVASRIISENSSIVADYKAGKTAALQFLIGQGMKATKGSANPSALKDIFIKLLS
jgi:aspartyl-tRNA(Asn)/glutamyl-tRNA(Gln) amidotransferase subunit B